MRTIFIILIAMLLMSCQDCKCQETQDVSAWISWQYDYQTEQGVPLSPSIINFKLYKSTDSLGTYQFYKQIPDTAFYLLSDPSLYDGTNWWWRASAIRIDTGTESILSPERVQGDHPILRPGIPYNFKEKKFQKTIN